MKSYVSSSLIDLLGNEGKKDRFVALAWSSKPPPARDIGAKTMAAACSAALSFDKMMEKDSAHSTK